MRIQCPTCRRDYDVDDARAAGIDQAMCACGARLALGTAPAGVARIGRYVLVNQIAVGGMGEIWFARQLGSDGFEKDVVIKRLLPNHASDREITAMLINEAKVSSRLKHGHIVEVYDLVHQGGDYLIVMEYVPGITVRDLVNACCDIDVVPPWQLAVSIVLQLLRGLGYAHRLPQLDGTYATFIHRDISPQNLLVCLDGTVKVTDFGIAKAINEASDTAPGLIRGKASYLTPERVRGGDVNEMSDLFPAAIILYETWTLHSLFRADNHEGTLRKLFEARVPPLAEHRQDVSPALETVMRRALSRRAGDRYPDARAFEAALVEACAPASSEQVHAVAAAFLAEHPHFFAAVAAHRGAPSAASIKAAVGPGSKAPPIEQLLRTPVEPQAAVSPSPAAAARILRPWQRAVAAVSLLALGFGVGFLCRPGPAGVSRNAPAAMSNPQPSPAGATPAAAGVGNPP